MRAPAIRHASLSSLLLLVLILNLMFSGCSGKRRPSTQKATGTKSQQTTPTASATTDEEHSDTRMSAVKPEATLTVRAKADLVAVSDSLPAGSQLNPPKARFSEAEEELTPKRYDQPREAAEFFRLKRIPEGETEVPIERYLTASEQMRRMPRYSTAQNRFLPSREMMKAQAEEQEALGTWESLGPGNVGGRTRALLIHPTQPNIMYAAGVAGGIWKTTNGGASWMPIADLLANIAISSMVMDPANPEIIYAGTGEGFLNSDAIRGAGIFRTTDGGVNWARLASTSTSDFYYVNDLVISPMNSQRLYAATRTGVWRSVDSGATWTRVLRPLSKNFTSSTVQGGCLDLAIRTDKATDYLFASCGTGEQAAIYRNPDASGSGAWIEIFSEDGMGRTSLAIAPSNQNIIYAAASSIEPGDYQSGLRAIFRSLSSGDPGTWTSQVRNSDLAKLNTVLFSNPFAAFLIECGQGSNNIFANQGWYDNAIAVDPFNPERVWVGGIDLFRSDDGGMNWGLASYWWANGTFRSLAPQYAHADHHVIAFHPGYNGADNQTLYVGTDGGIFRTDNAIADTARGLIGPCNPASSAVTWTSLNNGYGVTQFYHGAVYPDGTNYFGGTQDNGTLRGNDASGGNGWREILGGDGTYVAINPVNTNILYASNPFRTIQKSLDGGATFNVAVDGISDQYGLFINPFIMDPSDPQRLWTGGRWIWRTTNGASLWEIASDSTVCCGVVSAIAVAPTNANYVLVGKSAGEILRTDVGLTSGLSTTWAYRTPRSGFVSSVTFDPTNENIAYATYSTFGSTHVWRSTDAGATWTGIEGTGTGKLPDVPVHSIVVDPSDSSRLYIGTDVGVFVSTDTGQTWAVENTGFANVITESLTLNTVNGVTSLYAFTHGRGAWRVTTGTSGCNTTLSPTGQEFTSNGGTGNINVSVSPGNCSWTARSNADWITINSGTSGNGNGTVSFTVALNNTADRRVGTLAIAGKSFTVTQEKCDCSISPGRKIFAASGGTGTVNVTAANDSNWQAVSQVGWITITSGNTGTGNGAVNFTVAANTTNTPRTGTLTIAGLPFVVDQDSNGCTVTPITSGVDVTGSLSSSDCRSLVRGNNFASNYFADRYSFSGTAGQTVSITVPAKSFDEYLYLIGPDGSIIAQADTPPIPGSGLLSLPATGTYTLEITSYAASQTGTYTLRLTLDAVPGCTYTLSPASQSFGASGGSGSVNVTTGNNCQWQVTEDLYWVFANTGSKTGSGTVSYTVSSNSTENVRSGMLSIAGQMFPVRQDRCERPIIPINIGQTLSGTISTSDCKLNDNGDQFFDEYSFSGLAGQVVYAVVSATFPYASTTLFGPDGSRISGSLPVTGTYTLRITTTLGFRGDYKISLLPGTPDCLYSISPTSQSIGANGGNLSVNLTTANGCSWQAVSHADWITISSGNSGSGSSTVRLTVAPHTGTGQRSGEVFVAGQKFTVSQIGDGSNCTVTPITPGQPVSGMISSSDCFSSIEGSSRRADRYSFPGLAGQVADLTTPVFSGSSIGPALTLIDPDGTRVETGFVRDGSVVLPFNGTYLIEVRDLQFSTGLVYTLSLGLTSPGCTPNLSPGNAYYAASGGMGTINITPSPGNCGWSAITDVSWIAINDGNTGSGNRVVTYSVAANTSFRRTGAIRVGGQQFTVSQGGPDCPQAILPGQTVNGMLTSNCSSFAFDATAGQPVSFLISANGFSPSVNLYAPDGALVVQRVSSRFPSGIGFFSLPKSGTYIIDVSRSGSLSEPGTYKLSLNSGTLGCVYSVVANNLSFSAESGTGIVSVTTSNGCHWQALSDVDWISFNATGHSGSSTINFTVAANPQSAPRTGRITVAGQTFAITQNQIGSENNCTILPINIGQTVIGELSDTDCRSPVKGTGHFADRYSFAGTTGQAVAISFGSSAFDTFLYLIGPDGKVVIADDDGGPGRDSRIPANSGFFVLPANGTYLIEATSFSSNATGSYSLSLSVTSSCSSTLSVNSQSVSASSGTGSVNLTTGSGCNWIASSNAPWLTLTSSTSGSGNQTINYSVAVNTSTDPRSGILSIAGQTFTVTQEGRPCSMPLPINSGQVIGGALSANDCASIVLDDLTYRADRYSFSGAAGEAVTLALASSDFDSFLYLIGPNGAVVTEDDDGGTGLNSRIPAENGTFTLPESGTYTIEVTSFKPDGRGNYTFSLNAVNCATSLSPDSQPFPASGGNSSVNVSAPGDCAWTATSNAGWITITAGASGSGNGTVSFVVATNTAEGSRTGTLTIGGLTFTVMQAEANPLPTLSSLSPASTIAGSPDFTLTLTGTNFINGSVVRWNGNDRATTFVSSTQLTATITAADISSAGSASVTVFNPAPGGGLSNALNFTINGVPDLTIAKSHNTGFTVGTNGIYTIAIRNVGTAATTGVITVTDTLPTGLGFVSGGGNGWNCSVAGQSVTCTSNSALAPNEGSSFDLTVSVAAAAVPGVTNTASIATAGEVNTTNNTTNDPTAVACNFMVAPTSRSHEAGEETGNVTITASGDCGWNAVSNNEWITITVGTSGSGNGTVIYSVTANTTPTVRTGTLTIAGQTVTITQAATMASVSAASYSNAGLTAESITAAFGVGLATATEAATTIPLPVTLAGTTVRVRDSAGITRDAPLFFVSPNQVNYLIPEGTAEGAATVIITSSDGTVSTGTVQILPVAPALFTANADGQGAPAAQALRLKPDNTLIYEAVAQFDQAQNRFVPLPIDLGPDTDQVFLILFGTGIRQRSSLSAVLAKIGGVDAEVIYAGMQGSFVGLDQANVRVPRSLIGRGEVEVMLTVDGKIANTVTINIK